MNAIAFAVTRRKTTVSAIVALLAFAPATARASGLALVQRDCPSLDEHALRELVELELRTLSVSGDGVRVEIVCAGEIAAVTLMDARGQTYPIASRVDFAKAEPGARERLVALATTELVEQANHAEPAPKGEATVAPEAKATPRSSALPREARPASERVEIALLGVATVLGSPTTLLVGGTLGSRVSLSGPFSASIDVKVDHGGADTDLAHVTWTSFGGSGALLLGHRFSVVRLDAGAGLRVARLHLDATARSPDSGRALSGTWLGPMIPLRASFAVADHVALVATAEAGYVALPLRGTTSDGAPVAKAEGPWAALGAGLAATF